MILNFVMEVYVGILDWMGKFDAEKAWCQTCMTVALYCECSTWPDYLKQAARGREAND